MIVTLNNVNTVDNRPAVLAHLIKCLNRGDNIVIEENYPPRQKHEYCCSTRKGTAFRILV